MSRRGGGLRSLKVKESELERSVGDYLFYSGFCFYKQNTRGYFQGSLHEDASGNKVVLGRFQRDLGFEHIFTPHDTRHTYSTWLAEKTGGNFSLCQMILGHSSLETTMQYVHMGARIQRRLKAKSQLQVRMTRSQEKPKTIPLFPARSLNKVWA